MAGGMKTLIIGGTGVISTAVAQWMIDRGDEVTLLNRGVTPARLRGPFRALQGDRTDRPAFEAVLHKSGPWECVIDMVCSEPDDAAGAARALRGRTAQFIFCSTTNVYPKPADHYPVPEDHRLGAAYKNGIDKARCEAIHRAAEADGAYRTTIVRPGHTFGEGGSILGSLGGQPDTLLDRMRQGRPVVVHGDGNGLWSALHAEDVAQVFAGAAGNPVALGRTYHATGTEWVTWNQYHARIADALGVPLPELVHIPADCLARLAPERAAQCVRSLQYPGIYDMTAARTELGFEARLSIVDAMRRTTLWLEARGGFVPWQSDPGYDRLIEEWKRRLA